MLRQICAVTLVAMLPMGVPMTAMAEEATAAMTGDAAKGEKVFRKCQACHAVGPDAQNKVGPQLNGIVGRTTASAEGFAYSDAMAALGAEGHVWTVEELEKFLEKPRDMVSGTKMAFVGLRKPEERADIIAYLATFE